MLSSYHLIFDVTSSFQLPEAFQTFNVPFQWVETNWVLQGSTKSKNVVDVAQDSIVFHIVVLKAKRIVWTSLRYLDEIPIKYQSILLASVHPHGTSEGPVKRAAFVMPGSGWCCSSFICSNINIYYTFIIIIMNKTVLLKCSLFQAVCCFWTIKTENLYQFSSKKLKLLSGKL